VRRALRRLFLEPEPPLVAVEIRPRCIGVVRIGFEKGPSPRPPRPWTARGRRTCRQASNVLDPGALRAVLRSA
jgi:hypothetical protein